MLFRRKERIIARLLNDPLTRIVMRADGVDLQALARDLQRLSHRPKAPAARVLSKSDPSASLRRSFASPAKGSSTPCGACSS